jgi:molybdate transport system substrate-binding protein
MTKQSIVGSIIALGLASVMAATAANAAEIKVISTGSFKNALGELAPAFERSSGHKLTSTWAGTDEIVRRLSAGEPLDLVIAPAPWIDDLIGRGLVAAGSRVDVAKSGIGAAARAGAQPVDISSAAALRAALLGARSIALSTGVSGIYLSKVFAKWGIAAELEPRIIRLPGSGPVADAMVRGEADIGFLQVSEWLAVKGISFLGPLPPDIQEITVISVGLGKAAGAPDAARALVDFLASPDAAPAKRKTGLEPG